MIPVSKIGGVMSCGILLCLGLSGCVAPAGNGTRADQSAVDRIGGQAGLKGDQEKLKGIPDQSAADRIGGQAGLEPHLEMREVEAGQSAERIGGQAGLEAHLTMQEVGADQ
jgi:hypothetical protein